MASEGPSGTLRSDCAGFQSVAHYFGFGATGLARDSLHETRRLGVKADLKCGHGDVKHSLREAFTPL